jgi:hypothetical protein
VWPEQLDCVLSVVLSEFAARQTAPVECFAVLLMDFCYVQLKSLSPKCPGNSPSILTVQTLWE